MRRVAVTGMGGVCALGETWSRVREALRGGVSGVAPVPSWEDVDGLRVRVAALVGDAGIPEHYPRKKVRGMGRDSLMSVAATERALDAAGLAGDPVLGSGRTGVAYGSTAGSPSSLEVYARNVFTNRTLKGITGNDFVRFMSHTCAANVAQFFGIRGRLIPTSSACTSGSQGIGFAYEAIRHGQQDVMLAGGAEEAHLMDVVVFDVLGAASVADGSTTPTPRPFDAARDGVVVGEGAATLVLEELEHARARGARVLAEVVGFGTNCDGRHLTNPDAESMERVMRLALEDAGLEPSAIDYVNAHGTATEVGDIAESTATHAVFGERVAVSALKGHLGHALGACGSVEAWLAIEMLHEGWVAPTLHLRDPDPRCAPLDHVMGEPRALDCELVMTNNFAFGGVNTSIVLRRPER